MDNSNQPQLEETSQAIEEDASSRDNLIDEIQEILLRIRSDEIDGYAIYQILKQYFSLEELKTLTYLSSIGDFGDLSRSDFARELVLHQYRRDRLDQLVALIIQQNPNKGLLEKVKNALSPLHRPDGDDRKLVDVIASQFNISELQELCFVLQIDYEDVEGTNLSSKVVNLVRHAVNRNKFFDLIEQLSSVRPHTNWLRLAKNSQILNPISIRETAEENTTTSADPRIDTVTGTEVDTEPNITTTTNVDTNKPSGRQRNIVAGANTMINFVQEVRQIVDDLAEVKPGDFSKIAASQIELLSSFYILVVEQARQSFRWAIIAAAIGLAFFIVSITTLLLGETTDVALVGVVGGTLVEVIAGINFYLYNKATAQLSEFHSRLELTQKFLLGNSICEGLDDEFKQRARMELVRTMIGAEASTKESDVPLKPVEENNETKPESESFE